MQRIARVAGLGLLLASIAAGNSGVAQQPGPPLPPLPYPILRDLRADPQAWRQFRAEHAIVKPAPAEVPAAAPATVPQWIKAWPMALSNPLLLPDGTVLAHVSCTPTWWRLTPDINGSYAAGTWAKTAPMPAGYAPRFFASAVLPDGRVIVEGGEYNGASCDDVETTLGAIYDPQANTWAKVAPPSGWKTIGDASGIVLANGTFLLSNCCTTDLATLNPATLAWKHVGTGKADWNNEENWTLLPDGDLLTVDAYIDDPMPACGAGSEKFTPSTGVWSSAGSTVNRLSGCSGSIKNFEAPTQILRPTGTVAAFGATASTTNAPVHSAIYTASTGKWAVGPNMPKVDKQFYTMADAPAAILPDGTVLLAASPGVWPTNSKKWYPAPTHFFTFNGTGFTQVGDIKPDAAVLSSYEMNLLVLPTGEILGVETDYAHTEIFPAVCCASAGWAPAITKLSGKTLQAGTTYTLTGTQLSGLTEGATFGDDAQADTNFPLVRITSAATDHVFYARTFGFTRSVAAGAASSTKFVMAHATEAGPGKLVVVANGIASAPVDVTVAAP